jgi:hypothetical protein
MRYHFQVPIKFRTNLYVRIILLIITCGMNPLLISCSGTMDQPLPAEPVNAGNSESIDNRFLLTQKMLDAVIPVVAPSDTAITGNSFGVRNDGSDRSIKNIYTNKPTNRAIQVGDIIVIQCFINENGGRGTLEFVDIMVKRENGFDSSG